MIMNGTNTIAASFIVVVLVLLKFVYQSSEKAFVVFVTFVLFFLLFFPAKQIENFLQHTRCLFSTVRAIVGRGVDRAVGEMAQITRPGMFLLQLMEKMAGDGQGCNS